MTCHRFRPQLTVNGILIHTSVKLVTRASKGFDILMLILIHTSVKLVTVKYLLLEIAFYLF